MTSSFEKWLRVLLSRRFLPAICMRAVCFLSHKTKYIWVLYVLVLLLHMLYSHGLLNSCCCWPGGCLVSHQKGINNHGWGDPAGSSKLSQFPGSALGHQMCVDEYPVWAGEYNFEHGFCSQYNSSLLQNCCCTQRGCEQLCQVATFLPRPSLNEIWIIDSPPE